MRRAASWTLITREHHGQGFLQSQFLSSHAPTWLTKQCEKHLSPEYLHSRGKAQLAVPSILPFPPSPRGTKTISSTLAYLLILLLGLDPAKSLLSNPLKLFSFHLSFRVANVKITITILLPSWRGQSTRLERNWPPLTEHEICRSLLRLSSAARGSQSSCTNLSSHMP
jgi:hypothetical protein